MNNRKPTLKNEELMWITSDDWIWRIAVALMWDEDIRWALALEAELPVIRF
jgi:hypothetical protein